MISKWIYGDIKLDSSNKEQILNDLKNSARLTIQTPCNDPGDHEISIEGCMYRMFATEGCSFIELRRDQNLRFEIRMSNDERRRILRVLKK